LLREVAEGDAGAEPTPWSNPACDQLNKELAEKVGLEKTARTGRSHQDTKEKEKEVADDLPLPKTMQSKRLSTVTVRLCRNRLCPSPSFLARSRDRGRLPHCCALRDLLDGHAPPSFDDDDPLRTELSRADAGVTSPVCNLDPCPPRHSGPVRRVRRRL